jgi:hypothetical protein
MMTTVDPFERFQTSFNRLLCILIYRHHSNLSFLALVDRKSTF